MKALPIGVAANQFICQPNLEQPCVINDSEQEVMARSVQVKQNVNWPFDTRGFGG